MNKKIVIFAVISILLVSSLALAIEFAAARPSIIENISNRLTQASWVRLNGNISQWGTEDVRGQLQTQARTSTHESSGNKQLTSATAMWTTNTSRAIQSLRTKENFTYTYYVARLTNGSVSTLNADSATNSYFLNGTWNLAKITATTTVNTDENGTITHVHRDQDTTPSKAYGELSVNGNQFTLNINGIDQLSGSVYRQITRSWFNPFKMTDDSTNSAVTHTDVKTIAKCYGNMPGWGNFDASMDFNNNYRVDIADISTVAANL